MTVYLRANIDGTGVFRACAQVVVLRGPDAGAAGVIASPDRRPETKSASVSVILDTGRMVVVPRVWLRSHP